MAGEGIQCAWFIGCREAFGSPSNRWKPSRTPGSHTSLELDLSKARSTLLRPDEQTCHTDAIRRASFPSAASEPQHQTTSTRLRTNCTAGFTFRPQLQDFPSRLQVPSLLPQLLPFDPGQVIFPEFPPLGATRPSPSTIPTQCKASVNTDVQAVVAAAGTGPDPGPCTRGIHDPFPT